MIVARVLAVTAVLLLLAAIPSAVLCQEIFVWDMDGFDGGANGKTFQDPEGSGIIGCEYWIQQALAQNGHSCSTWAEMNLPPDISTYDVIFIVLGWCWGEGKIGQGDQLALIDFLLQGKAIYVEGNDFAYDHRPGAGNYYGLYDYLGIKFIDDGNTSFIGNVDTLEGMPGTWTEGMREKYMLYDPPDHYVDEIGPHGGTMIFRCQRGIGRVVAHAGTEVPYRTVTAMHVFGAIKNAESTHTKAELMALYLEYLIGDTVPPAAPNTSASLQNGILRLEWPPVTQDVNGDPESIAYYVVYRGETAFFRPEPGCVLATVQDTTYDDATAAVGSVTINHFYAVRAVDASWNPSALSNRVGEFDFATP